ncbi:MAG TPA: nucleotidyltransferase family protein [Candidatus Binatia bacterium]|jgi:molybdenum cofactor cytidylyltransferase
MSGFVSGLVLAAGTSSRLGEKTKQLLPWQGMPLVEWVARQAEAAPLDEVIVVVGHKADELRRNVTLTRARFVEAPGFHEGCTASIRAGLEAADARADAVALVLGDQPGIESATIAAAIDFWRRTEAPAARVSYRGRPGHPLVFAKSLFGELKALHGDKGVWKLLDRHREWVREIEVDKPYPGDINTWEDYVKLAAAVA